MALKTKRLKKLAEELNKETYNDDYEDLYYALKDMKQILETDGFAVIVAYQNTVPENSFMNKYYDKYDTQLNALASTVDTMLKTMEKEFINQFEK